MQACLDWGVFITMEKIEVTSFFIPPLSTFSFYHFLSLSLKVCIVCVKFLMAIVQWCKVRCTSMIPYKNLRSCLVVGYWLICIYYKKKVENQLCFHIGLYPLFWGVTRISRHLRLMIILIAYFGWSDQWSWHGVLVNRNKLIQRFVTFNLFKWPANQAGP